MKKLLLTAILLVLLPFTTMAQDTWNENKKVQLIVGANVTIESAIINFNRMSGGNHEQGLIFTPGLSFESRFSRNSGIETGLYCRFDNLPNSSNSQYLSVPLLYKFYSKILNFAIGAKFDFLIGGPSHGEGHDIGALLKITKDIKLYKGLFIEPYIQTNFSRHNKLYVGVGLGLKYRF